MKLFNTILIVAVLAISSIPATAQEFKPCGIYQMELLQQQQHPSLAAERSTLESFTAEYIKHAQGHKTTSGVILYTIPVVFHIMHNYGVENISKAQVLDEVRIMNEDFQKRNADTAAVATYFKPIVADCQIEFKLALLDPNGNCTDGITHYQTTLTYNADDNVKALIGWPSDQYLNIWVVSTISFGAAGYAYYPGIGPAEDGIVILNNYCGSIGTSPGTNYNRHSLSHEIGHYLNLRHTWGNSNTPGDPNNCFDDDLVFDTPNTVGVANFSCDTNQITCTPGVPDNVQNYMDYASCHNMFTQGQKTRMFAALNSGASSRDNLWAPGNLISTGTNAGFVSSVTCTPVADFSNIRKTVCQNTPVSFTDVSWNLNSAYTRVWSFSGGTPATSTDSIPVVSYSTPGTYDVTLTLTTSTGSVSISRQQLIDVMPTTATSIAPYSQGFETITVPGGNWKTINDGGPMWTISNTAASSGSKSIRIQNSSFNPVDGKDAFITEGIDISSVTSPLLTFKLAFATKNNSTDALRIYGSDNCGQTWKLRYAKSGSLLATAGDLLNNFVPNLSQWNTETVNLNTFTGLNNLRLKFEFTNQGGNNIYIDDINISGIPLSIDELNAAALQLSLQPNPAQSQTTLSYTLEKNENVKIELYDLVGKCVQHINNSKQAAGKHQFTIQKPSTGMFLLKMIAGDKQVIQKIIFE